MGQSLMTKSLTSRLRARFAETRRRSGGEEASRIAQFWWAMASLCVVVALVAVAALLYVHPPGYRQFVANFPESGNVVPGADVRVGGVRVGKVVSMKLQDEAVRVLFTVRDGIRIGRESAVDVRMATPIGGVYLAVTPAGPGTIGAEGIPPDRVTLPYQVSKLLPDATVKIRQVDTAGLERTLADVSDTLRAIPNGGLTDMVTSADKLSAVFAQQRRAVDAILELTGNYADVITENRKQIDSVVDALANLITQLYPYIGNIGPLLGDLNSLIGFLGASVPPLANQKFVPIVETLISVQPSLDELGGSVGSLISRLSGIINGLADSVSPAGVPVVKRSQELLRLSQACVPTPNRGC